MKVLIGATVFLVCVAGAFGHCLEFSMGLIIDTGGGGDFVIEYDSTDPEYCNEDDHPDIVAEYRGSGGNVSNIVIEEPQLGKIEVSYNLDFDDIADTDDFGVFGFFSDIDQTLTLTQNTNYNYRNSITVNGPNYEVYKKFTYTFHVTCPYDVISTNGTETSPRTISWSYSFYDLVENGTTDLTITYAAD